MRVKCKVLGRLRFLENYVIGFGFFEIRSRDRDSFSNYFDVRWIYGYGRWVNWFGLEGICSVRVIDLI